MLRLPDRLMYGTVVLLGVLLLAVLALINGSIGAHLLTFNTHVQFALLCGGVGLVVWGLSGNSQQNTSEHTPPRPAWRLPCHHLILLGITALALALRLWQLDGAVHYWIDEQQFANATVYFRERADVRLLAPFTGVAAFPWLYPYWQAGGITLLGANLLGLRVVSALLGTLTIPAIYLLGAALWDRPTGLLAALLLATFPPHIQFSRVGISEIAGPLFGTLGLAFVARGLTRYSRMDFALGGALLGMTHYFHEGSRLFFTPLATAWITAVLVIQRPRGRLRLALLAGLALLLVAIPIYYTLLAQERSLLNRLSENSAGLDGQYWRQLFEGDNWERHVAFHILPAFFSYTTYPDTSFFYMGHTALLLVGVMPVFFLGLFALLWRWRWPGALLGLGWLLSLSLGNSFLTSSLDYPRYVMGFPALGLVLAAGIRFTIPLIWPIRFPVMAIRIQGAKLVNRLRWPPRRPARHQAALMAVCGALLAVIQVNYYYGDHLLTYERMFRASKATPDGYNAALRSADFPEGTQVHIISRGPVNQLEASGLLEFIKDDSYLDTWLPERITMAYLKALPCGVDHAFFIEATDLLTLYRLNQIFYLRSPQFTQNQAVPLHDRLVLYYAPHIPGSEKLFTGRCAP
jgi:4-amino-4-deoxy-L-arabinose transferase-like glycosyltransferase